MNKLEDLLKEVVQLEALKREAEIKLWKEIKKLVSIAERKESSKTTNVQRAIEKGRKPIGRKSVGKKSRK
jgi:hypothetical protein